MNRANFVRRFTYWSLHAIFCATPSFFIAYTSGYSTPGAVVGMLAGILTFILLYTCVSLAPLYGRKVESRPFWKKVVTRASLCRSFISAMGFSVMWLGLHDNYVGLFILPDFWAGMAAVRLTTEMFSRGFGYYDRVHGSGELYSFWLGTYQSCIPTYITTLLEGFIITATLLILVAVFGLIGYCYRLLKSRMPI